MLCLLLLLAGAIVGVVYWFVQNGSQRNFRDQLAAAQQAGAANTLEQVQPTVEPAQAVLVVLLVEPTIHVEPRQDRLGLHDGIGNQ